MRKFLIFAMMAFSISATAAKVDDGGSVGNGGDPVGGLLIQGRIEYVQVIVKYNAHPGLLPGQLGSIRQWQGYLPGGKWAI